MTHDQFIDALKQNQKKLYSIDLNGITIPNSEYLKILIRKHEALNFPKWLEEGKVSSPADIRHQLFMRIELATIHYYQSIVSTLNDFENIWTETKRLGYTNEFTTIAVTFREVSIRTTFIEKVFFAIDYFIQQMNSQLKFHTSESIHKKQQYFKLLLEKLDIAESIETNLIVDDLIAISKKIKSGMFVKGRNRQVELHELYTYFVAFRNVFHNNGYSQKTLNKLNIGGVIFNIKKGVQIDFGHDTVVTIVFLMLYPLERIVEQSFIKYPNQIWEDQYTVEMKDYLEEMESKRNSRS